MALSDILTPSFVEVGKLKIGGKGEARKTQSGGTWRPPEKWDHFVVTTLHRDADDRLIPDTLLMESLADCRDPDGLLRRVPVMFASNDLDQLMTSRYVWYVGKRLGAVSDGKTLTWHLDPRTGEPLKEPVPDEPWDAGWLADPDPRQRSKPRFKLFTTLNVMIASAAARWGGFYRFRTTSEISARQLYGSLLHLKKLTGGILRGLVFRLVVRPMMVAPEGKPSTVYVVHVEYVNSDLRQLQTAAREQAAFELENLKAVRETELAYRQLAAHEDADDPDEEAVAEPPRAIEAPRASPKPSPEAERTEMLRVWFKQAETVDTVVTAWNEAKNAEKAGKITRAQLESLIPDKDAAKARVRAGEKPAPPAAEPPKGEERQAPPAEPPQEQGEPEQQQPPAATPPKAGAAIVKTITQLTHMLGTTWPDWRAEHAEALGFAAKLPGDLTAEQAQAVYAVLKEQVRTRGAGAGEKKEPEAATATA